MRVKLAYPGFKIAVSEIIEQTDFENGFDLVDYYFMISKILFRYCLINYTINSQMFKRLD